MVEQVLYPLVGILLQAPFSIVMAIVAKRKGYNPWLWILPVGLVGVMILWGLRNTRTTVALYDERTHAERVERGNRTGGVLTAFTAAVIGLRCFGYGG